MAIWNLTWIFSPTKVKILTHGRFKSDALFNVCGHNRQKSIAILSRTVWGMVVTTISTVPQKTATSGMCHKFYLYKILQDSIKNASRKDRTGLKESLLLFARFPKRASTKIGCKVHHCRELGWVWWGDDLCKAIVNVIYNPQWARVQSQPPCSRN